MIFSKEYLLEPFYSKNTSSVDNASIFELFTTHSRAHSDHAGVVLPEDIVWMVLDWKLHVTRRPKTGERCTVRTWVPAWNKALCLRCYDIIDAKGCKCVEASSRWALANKKTRKLFLMNAEIMDLYGIAKGVSEIENAPFMKNIGKKAVPLKSETAEISGDMIDENGHLHNTVYSTLAESVLPAGANIDAVDISYRKEISGGERLILDYCRYEDSDAVLIRTDGAPAPNAIALYGK